MTTPSFFRRRTIGRAASPPTWACYEQIPYDDDEEDDDCSDSNSEDNSCSEDGDDYGVNGNNAHGGSDSESEHVSAGDATPAADDKQDESLDMEIDGETGEGDGVKKNVGFQKDVKGKQRAIEPEPESPKRHHRRKRREVCTLRPILTIQRSQGFVWNQDLFVPPYIKDRYVASTSPPNSRGFVNCPSSNGATLNDYEVEVVEIRVSEGDLDGIIP